MTPFSYTVSVNESGQIYITKLEKKYPLYYGWRHVEFSSLAEFDKHFKREFGSYEFDLRRALVAWAFEKMSAYSVYVYACGDIEIWAEIKAGDGFGPSTGIGG